jgi:hypothetical protein
MIPNTSAGRKALPFAVAASVNVKAKSESSQLPSPLSASLQSSEFAPSYPDTSIWENVAFSVTKTQNMEINFGVGTVSGNLMPSLSPAAKRLPYSNSNSAD